MCDECSDLPKGSLRRLGDLCLCQECWEGLEQSHRGFYTVGKNGLSEEDLIREAKMVRGAGRLFHRTFCRKCHRWFRECEALVQAAKSGEMLAEALLGTRLVRILRDNVEQ